MFKEFYEREEDLYGVRITTLLVLVLKKRG